MHFRRVAKWLGIALAAMVALAGLYLGAAYALARWTVNDDFQSVAGGIPIGLSSNGIHANLHFPVQALDVDWTDRFPLATFPTPPVAPATIAFGWGSREFYLNTPTWDDFDLGVALTAITGMGGAAMHVSYWAPWPQGENYVEVRVSEAAYRSLVAHIEATMRTDDSGGPLRIPGYSYLGNDLFYEANGSYQLFMTCNEWVRDALADAGVRTGVWSPFPDALLDHLR